MSKIEHFQCSPLNCLFDVMPLIPDFDEVDYNNIAL